MVLGTTFIKRFEEYCPQWLAESNDPVGLQIGTLDKEIQRVMMTLDVRPEVVLEAIEKKVDLLIAKHPPIFRAIKTLTATDPQTKMYLDLAKHDIAVYAAHTNMDIIENGLNDWFCEDLGIVDTRYLIPTHKERVVALTLRGLSTSEQVALQKICSERFDDLAGGIDITQYEGECTLMILEKQVATVLEFLVSQGFDPWQIVDTTTTKSFGIGRIGTLNTPQPLHLFAQHVKQTFGLTGLRVIPVPNQVTDVKTVAICGGSGGNFYTDALEADVYITGDIYYHTAHDMQAHGLAAIDPGHHIEERCILKFVDKMVEWTQKEDWPLEIIGSTTNTNPFLFQ